jgi:enolase
MTLTLDALDAWEILDSRGNPTLAVEACLSNGVRAQAQTPSGASTGRHEAVELRDGDPQRYDGRGVTRAAANVLTIRTGIPVEPLCAFDGELIAADGTPDKSRLGANAILAVSCAAARALAISRGIPLWHLLATEFRVEHPLVPLPMINIISGGLHAGAQIEFQDFLAVPHGFDTLAEALHAVVRIHQIAKRVLEERGHVLTGVADEGGWGPRLPSNEAALEVMMQAIGRAGYRPGEQVSIGIDAAATHFFQGGKYHLRSEQRALTPEEMIGMLHDWMLRYPIVSIEDGLAEDDWAGWRGLTQALGQRCQLVGDDLFTTNPNRARAGIEQGAANSVLVKMNQIGTLTETFETLKIAREGGYTAVISARSGETEDSFLADLAVASGAGQIKVGSITRSERLAKYNRLLEISSREHVSYAAERPLARWLSSTR